jgi:hypothetical protein
MGNGHEPVQGQPANDGIEGEVNLHDIELDVLCAEVLLGPECYQECGWEGPSQDPRIYSYLNAAWLMTLSQAPPSIRT